MHQALGRQLRSWPNIYTVVLVSIDNVQESQRLEALYDLRDYEGSTESGLCTFNEGLLACRRRDR
jgi:hypothetical protein